MPHEQKYPSLSTVTKRSRATRLNETSQLRLTDGLVIISADPLINAVVAAKRGREREKR